jgi:hypothetical protein
MIPILIAKDKDSANRIAVKVASVAEVQPIFYKDNYYKVIM